MQNWRRVVPHRKKNMQNWRRVVPHKTTKMQNYRAKRAVTTTELAIYRINDTGLEFLSGHGIDAAASSRRNADVWPGPVSRLLRRRRPQKLLQNERRSN